MAEDSAIVAMDAVPVIDDPGNKTDELLRREAIGAAPTPHHPDVGRGEVEYVNGPQAKRTYAVGSLVYQQQREKTDAA